MQNMLPIKEASRLTGLAQSTLRRLHATGEFVPQMITKGKTRYYSMEQINEYIGKEVSNKNRIVIGYCRVSSRNQKDDLDRQVERMELYLTAQGKPFEIITDIGSGLNYKKKGLDLLLEKLNKGVVEKVVVLYKDRLVRFGFELIEKVASLNNATIEIIDNTNKKEPQQEMMEDLVQIMTVFSARLQGERAKKTKMMIQELVEVKNAEG